MTSLAGKTAIVTGAARGIGAAIVDRFAAEGMRVAAFDLNPPSPPADGLACRVDVADEALAVSGEADDGGGGAAVQRDPAPVVAQVDLIKVWNCE